MLGLFGALLLAGVLGRASAAPAKAPDAAGAQVLSKEARAVMRTRMKSHGPEMEQLIWSVVLLQRAQTQAIADRMGSAAKLARPLPGQLDTVNAAVPELFFGFQDNLHARARELGDAAKTKDDEAIGRAFGKLAETCVACHARYLE